MTIWMASDDLLARALFMNARTKERSVRAKSDRHGFAEASEMQTDFLPHEPAPMIERMWDIAPDDPWAPHRQTWINEAKSLKEAIALLTANDCESGDRK